MDILQFILLFKDNLFKRDFIIDLFTECERVPFDDTSDNKHYHGQIVEFKNKVCYFDIDKGKPIPFKAPKSPLLNIYDRITLKPGDLANVTETIDVTIGGFIFNFIVITSVFGDKIPYNKGLVKGSKLEDQIVKLAMKDKIVPSDINDHYYPNLYYLRQFSNLFVPSASDACITPSKKILAMRDELFEKNKDKLDDPVVLTQMEDELIAALKEELKGDPSYPYLISSGKLIDICIKRMFIAGGVTPYKDGNSTKYKFIKNSLDEEWSIEDFPTLVNEVRIGISGRALSTADGGVMVNYLQRNFMDVEVTEDKCNTKKTYDVILTEDKVDSFLYMNVRKPDGSVVTLTDENANEFIGKKVSFFSPLYCTTEDGYCRRCLDKLSAMRETETVASMESRLGSAVLSVSMSALHGTKAKIYEINSLNQFLS